MLRVHILLLIVFYAQHILVLHNMNSMCVGIVAIFWFCAEVNASPSLNTDTAADHQLKWGLVEDALMLVDVEGKLEGQLPLSFGG